MSRNKQEYKVLNKPEAVETGFSQEIPELANRIARSGIAVIDTIVQRGGFRGEELTTIGQLRDQCVQMTAMVEQYQLGGD
tara:strand:- start:3091 stop:3330 length:240 start_codon:yes stop_codon:yes gene_type:complete